MSKINPMLIPFEIGDIFITTNNLNPSTRFGGTWELYAKGKTIVGYDSDDTDFNVIGKTGGSKELQAHSHIQKIDVGQNIVKHENGGSAQTTSSGSGGTHISGTGTTSNKPEVSTFETGTGNSGNLQPYKVFAIWVRIA